MFSLLMDESIALFNLRKHCYCWLFIIFLFGLSFDLFEHFCTNSTAFKTAVDEECYIEQLNIEV